MFKNNDNHEMRNEKNQIKNNPKFSHGRTPQRIA